MDYTSNEKFLKMRLGRITEDINKSRPIIHRLIAIKVTQLKEISKPGPKLEIKHEKISLLKKNIFVPKNPLSLNGTTYTGDEIDRMLQLFEITDEFNKLRINYYVLNGNYSFIDVYLSLYIFIQNQDINIIDIENKIKDIKRKCLGYYEQISFIKFPEPIDMESYKLEDKNNQNYSNNYLLYIY